MMAKREKKSNTIKRLTPLSLGGVLTRSFLLWCRVVRRGERLRPLIQPQQLWQEEHEEHEEHEECEEFKYQFLDQDACSLSRPLNAMDAL